MDDDYAKPSFHCTAALTETKEGIHASLSNFSLISRIHDLNKRSEFAEQLPNNGELRAAILGDEMQGEWSTDVPTKGSFLARSIEGQTQAQATKIMLWHEFRSWILEEHHSKRSLVYRGHTDSQYKLLTSFHRHGRRDLLRYVEEDIPRLQRHISATLGRRFDTNSGIELSELLYLAQHHGFPTPFLDWTYSPFVAAFFAFHSLPKNDNSGYVRIFIFDESHWHNRFARANDIAEPGEFFSMHSFEAQNNPRAIPQQSVVAYANIPDIEAYIDVNSDPVEAGFLRAVDIPKESRKAVMLDLEIMGITAAALFPGLDGVCSALRESLF